MSGLFSYEIAIALFGILLLALDAAIFGFSSFYLVFLAIGCILTSLGMSVDLIPSNFLAGSLSVTIFSALAAIILWKPLKIWQSNSQSVDEQPSAFDGMKFVLEEKIFNEKGYNKKFSGILWEVLPYRAQGEIEQGVEVTVKKVEVGKMFVSKV